MARTASALKVMRLRPCANFSVANPLHELEHLERNKDVLMLHQMPPKQAARSRVNKKIPYDDPQHYAYYYWVRTP